MTETTREPGPATEPDTKNEDEAVPMLVFLDPHDLAAHPLNIRDDIDVRDLVDSVRARGILQPPLVASTGDGAWRIVAGHRRIAAAVEAGLTKVACLVREDLAGDIDAVVGMLIENVHRADLTDLERARGYQQLLDLGVPRTKIAKRTGTRPTQVRNALTVIGNPAAVEAAEAGLTLDQALVIAEFDNDTDAVEALYEAAADGDGVFQHTASQLRQDRQDRAERSAAHDALVATGVTVIDPTDTSAFPSLTSLTGLVNADEDRTPIEPDTHTSCPGHAAALDQWHNDTIRYYCTDPATHGHRNRWGTTPASGNQELTDDEREARRDERATVVANNKAWRAAEPVRRAYLRDLLARKRPPAGTIRYVTDEIMRSPERVGDASDGLLADILGTDAPRGTYGRTVGPALTGKATDTRLPLVLLAQIAADRETTMTVDTWRHPNHTAARWLTWLTTTGYTLADIEQHAITLATVDPDTAGPDPTDDPDDDIEPESTTPADATPPPDEPPTTNDAA